MKAPAPESLFNRVGDMALSTLLKKRLQYRCFPGNFANFLIAPFLQNISGRLFLKLPTANDTSKKMVDWFIEYI